MNKAVFTLAKLPLNKPEPFWADDTHDWMKDILGELNSEFSPEEVAEAKSFMRFKGEIHKIDDSKLDDVMVLVGELSGRYCTLCGRSGDTIADEINVEIKAAFVDQTVIEKYNMQEEVNVLIKEDEFDMFSFQGKKVDITQAIKEYVYLNKNPYPIKQ